MGLEITMTFPDGATAEQIAARMRMQAGLIEGMEPKEAAANENTQSPPKAKAKAKPKAAAAPVDDDDEDFQVDDNGATPDGFDDDETAVEAASADEDFTDEEEAPKKKGVKGTKAKAKKITLDDINDACKAYARAHGREATLAILQRKFKTKSVTALKPEQYEACLAAMAVN